MRTAWLLMVMPRSRSRSILSRSCSFMSRAATVPVTARTRSASVDLPWSMWAMMLKLRMWSSEVTTDNDTGCGRGGRPAAASVRRHRRPSSPPPELSHGGELLELEDLGEPEVDEAAGHDRHEHGDQQRAEAAGGLVYLRLAKILKLEELATVRQLWRRRRGPAVPAD